MFVLVLTGPPGVGKTSVLTALADALSDDDVAHAAIEVEALRWAHPALGGEREMLHLEALSTMYREAGYELLLLARTVETDQELVRLLEAARAEERFVVRLEARPATLVRPTCRPRPAQRSAGARPDLGDSLRAVGRGQP